MNCNMKPIFNYFALTACALLLVGCNKSNPEDRPEIDPTSLEAFNALIFADYHSVADTVADLSTMRILFEAQAVLDGYLDELEGEPKMESYYCIVELHYVDKKPQKRSYRITRDLLTGERVVNETFDGWIEDCAMPLVPTITLKDAYLRLAAAGTLPHTKVVTLREDIMWHMQGIFSSPQYVFGNNGLAFVDSITGEIVQ